MRIGEKIFELRTKNGLSQGALAEYLNVSRQSVSKWETGQAIPDVGNIMKLSEIFNVTVDYLVKDNNNLENKQAKLEYQQKGYASEISRNKIPGYILIATGLLLVGLSSIFSIYALLIGIIFFIIGVEWILVKTNLSLVIAWTILLISFYFFNPWTTGVTTRWIFDAIMTNTFYSSIIIGIIQRIYGIILLLVTVRVIINEYQVKTKECKL